MPTNLSEEVLHGLGRLKQMMHAVEGRALTAREQDAIDQLIQTLRDLLGPDLADLLDF